MPVRVHLDLYAARGDIGHLRSRHHRQGTRRTGRRDASSAPPRQVRGAEMVDGDVARPTFGCDVNGRRIAALLEQRQRLQSELAEIQSQINDEFDRISREAEHTLAQVMA